MIPIRERSNPNEAGRGFAEWASLYSGKIFVMITAFLDESGTHDESAQQPGAAVPIIAGYVATVEEWSNFCPEWKKVLDEDKVKYFHYREFNDRDERKSNSESFYYGWDDEKAEAFEYKLAEIAGRQIPLVGHYDLKTHKEELKEDKTYSYAYVMDVFFRDLVKRIENHYPHLDCKVNFIMDQNSDKRWVGELIETVRCYREKGGYRWMGDIGWSDKKEVLPLQAADMIAFRSRQLAAKYYSDNQRQFAGVLNIMILRNMRPNRAWRPHIPPEEFGRVYDLAEKYPYVNRALSENSAIYFRLKNEREKRQKNRNAV